MSHIDAPDLVLAELNRFNLLINVNKCKFELTEIIYLGFWLDHNGVQPDLGRVKPLVEWPRQKKTRCWRSWGSSTITELTLITLA